MASNAGKSSAPSAVNSYSVDGGDVRRTCRTSTPLASNSVSRAERTLAEIGGISDRSSLNRRGPARKDQITFGAQAPDITAMHSVNMHGSGGVTLLFLRIFRDIFGNQVTAG